MERVTLCNKVCNVRIFDNTDVTSNIMKTFKQTIIWTIGIFFILTVLTMKNEASSDGISSYGFPLTFYNLFNGKCDNCYDQYGFKILSLLTDIGIIAVIVFIVIQLKNKFSRQR